MKLEEKLVLQTFWEKIKKYFATKLYVATLKSSKQDTLIAGKGIRIVNNVISNSLFPYKHKNEQGEWVIEGSDEKVIVTLFGPPGFNLENRQITLTYYLNNEPVLPARVITKTTDSNGVVIFSSDPETGDGTGVPVGYEYEITFPKISNYLEITPEKHVAGVVERNIEVSYIPLPLPEDDDYGEEITIHLDKFENNEVTPFEGVSVSVKIGTAAATTYTTDENGNTISFKVRYGLTYTVTVPTMTNYYIQDAIYTLTYTSEKRRRDISFMYKFVRVGVLIVDKNGKEYTGEEWEHFRDDEDVDEQDRVVNEDAILIKIATSTLAAHNGIFGLDIDGIRERTYNTAPFSNIGILFNSVPSSGGALLNKLKYYYNGLTPSKLVLQEGDERAITTTAVDRCLNTFVTLNIFTSQGFLGSVGLWRILWSNRLSIDALLELTRPNGTYLMSTWTILKRTISQETTSRGSMFFCFTTEIWHGGNGNTSWWPTIPFFTC